MPNRETVLVTGASRGIGEYNVAATARSMTQAGFAPPPYLARVDGDIGEAATAERVAQAAMANFGSIDHVVNSAGIFSVKPFTE